MSHDKFSCPQCGKTTGLCIFLTGTAMTRIPIKKGKLDSSREVCFDVMLSSSESYSASDVNGTRVIFFPEEGVKAELHCKACNKAFDVDISGDDS